MKRQPGSGCGRIFKEDLVDEVYLGQAKSTRSSRVSIGKKDLARLRKHAKDKKPMFVIGFYDDKYIREDDVWIAVPLRDWTSIRARI